MTVSVYTIVVSSVIDLVSDPVDGATLDPTTNDRSYVQTVSEAALLQALSGSLTETTSANDTEDPPRLPHPPTSQAGSQEKQPVTDESTAALLSIVNALSSVPGVQSQVLSVRGWSACTCSVAMATHAVG